MSSDTEVLEIRLAQANCYKILLGESFFTDPGEVESLVEAEIKDFITDKLYMLLGLKGRMTEGFNPDDVIILKKLAESIRIKGLPAAPANKTPVVLPQPAPKSPSFKPVAIKQPAASTVKPKEENNEPTDDIQNLVLKKMYDDVKAGKILLAPENPDKDILKAAKGDILNGTVQVVEQPALPPQKTKKGRKKKDKVELPKTVEFTTQSGQKIQLDTRKQVMPKSGMLPNTIDGFNTHAALADMNRVVFKREIKKG